jgi:DNA repair exonuclease SbcCD ATPase subunit
MSESTELTVVERAALALGTAEHEKNLLALATKYADITKIVNPAGREQCHSAYMELKNTRVAIATAGKVAREDANAFQKAVIAEVDRLTAITAAEEGRLQALRDAYGAEREAERLAKAAADRARVNSIRAKIDEIKDCLVVGMGRSSGELASAISELETTEITLEEYGDFAGEAQAAQAATVVKLKEMLTAQVDREASQARLAAEREALERQRAELAEQERQAAAARAEQEARDRAERERVEAEQRAAQEQAAAAMCQQQAEHEARMLAQQREIDRQQAELAAERQRQADEAARVEREKQAAIAAEAARVAAEEQRKREEAEAAARAEAERLEREAAAEVERAALAAEVDRLQSLIFANDGLGMLEDVLQEIAIPVGQECCGQAYGECCGNAEPVFHTLDSLSTELNKWHREIIQRRFDRKEAA